MCATCDRASNRSSMYMSSLSQQAQGWLYKRLIGNWLILYSRLGDTLAPYASFDYLTWPWYLQYVWITIHFCVCDHAVVSHVLDFCACGSPCWSSTPPTKLWSLWPSPTTCCSPSFPAASLQRTVYAFWPQSASVSVPSVTIRSAYCVLYADIGNLCSEPSLGRRESLYHNGIGEK